MLKSSEQALAMVLGLQKILPSHSGPNDILESESIRTGKSQATKKQRRATEECNTTINSFYTHKRERGHHTQAHQHTVTKLKILLGPPRRWRPERRRSTLDYIYTSTQTSTKTPKGVYDPEERPGHTQTHTDRDIHTHTYEDPTTRSLLDHAQI